MCICGSPDKTEYHLHSHNEMDGVAYVPVSKKYSISIRSSDNFEVKRIHVSNTSRAHKAHTLIHIWDTNVTTFGFVWTVAYCQAYTGQSEKTPRHTSRPRRLLWVQKKDTSSWKAMMILSWWHILILTTKICIGLNIIYVRRTMLAYNTY